jgi:hypothetical protein
MTPNTPSHTKDAPAQASRPRQQADSRANGRFRRFIASSRFGEDVVLIGRPIVYVSSLPSQASQATGGLVATWTELALYVTATGDYVCHEACKSALADEPTQSRVRVIERLDRYPLWTDGSCPASGTVRLSDEEMHKRIRQFFSNSSLAKRLYVESDIGLG